MTDLNTVFQKARTQSAARIADTIKTLIEGTQPGKKPDHQGAMLAAMIAEITQLSAGIEVMEVQVKALRQNMDETAQSIQAVVQHLVQR